MDGIRSEAICNIALYYDMGKKEEIKLSF
jgi:hypothetical protein